MAKFQEKEITDRKVWERFVLSSDPGSFLQSWNWGCVQEKLGNRINRVGIFDQSELVGVYLAITLRAKRGLHILIPGGPVINWKDRNLVDYCVKSVRNLGDSNRAWFVRLRPDILANKENLDLMKGLGFVSAPMHLHAENTWILDIDKKDEELLYGMRKSTRYLVRKSLKMPFEVRKSKNLKDYQILARLQEETIKRHNFVGFDPKIFKAQLETFAKDDQGGLFICEYKSKILAAAIIIYYHDTAYYHHSGSASGYDKIPFSYFLQWMIIKEAKKAGLKKYNFWGIAPENVRSHRFAGVTTFKKGFGGERVDWLHAQDMVIDKKYWATYIFENARKLLRGL